MELTANQFGQHVSDSHCLSHTTIFGSILIYHNLLWIENVIWSASDFSEHFIQYIPEHWYTLCRLSPYIHCCQYEDAPHTKLENPQRKSFKAFYSCMCSIKVAVLFMKSIVCTAGLVHEDCYFCHFQTWFEDISWLVIHHWVAYTIDVEFIYVIRSFLDLCYCIKALSVGIL